VVLAALLMACIPAFGQNAVMVAKVEQKDVPIYGEWIGMLEGFVNTG